MIVCSCNVFTDHDVRSTLAGGAVPRTTCQVYHCLGCSAQCGRCARTIRRIMDEALAAAETNCCGAAPLAAGAKAAVEASSRAKLQPCERPSPAA